MTSKGLLTVLVALLLAFAVPAYTAPSPNATCGNVVCDAGCPAGFASVGSGGVTFRPMCISGSPASGCQYSLCTHRSTAVCAAADPGAKQGCSSDGECPAGDVCISSSGDPGCNTGFSQCFVLVTTTTTTTIATTTTTASTTTTTASTTTTTTA